jgi:hypothetical protein
MEYNPTAHVESAHILHSEQTNDPNLLDTDPLHAASAHNDDAASSARSLPPSPPNPAIPDLPAPGTPPDRTASTSSPPTQGIIGGSSGHGESSAVSTVPITAFSIATAPSPH